MLRRNGLTVGQRPNAECRCGSGKKFKKCCNAPLDVEGYEKQKAAQAARAARAQIRDITNPPPGTDMPGWLGMAMAGLAEFMAPRAKEDAALTEMETMINALPDSADKVKLQADLQKLRNTPY